MTEEKTNTSESAIASSLTREDMYPAVRRYVFYGEWCSDPTVLGDLEVQPDKDVLMRAEKVYRNGYCLNEPVFYLPWDTWVLLQDVEWKNIPLEKEEKFEGFRNSPLKVALFQMNAHRTLHHAMAAFVYAEAVSASKRSGKRVRCVSPGAIAALNSQLKPDIPKDEDIVNMQENDLLRKLNDFRTFHAKFLGGRKYEDETEEHKTLYMIAGEPGAYDAPLTVAEVYTGQIVGLEKKRTNLPAF